MKNIFSLSFLQNFFSTQDQEDNEEVTFPKKLEISKNSRNIKQQLKGYKENVRKYLEYVNNDSSKDRICELTFSSRDNKNLENLELTGKLKDIDDLCLGMCSHDEQEAIISKHFSEKEKTKPLILIVSSSKFSDGEFVDFQSATVVFISNITSHQKIVEPCLQNPECVEKSKLMTYEVCQNYMHFHIEGIDNQSNLNEIIDSLLDNTLFTGRPVQHYLGTFYLPFILNDKNKEEVFQAMKEEEKWKKLEYETKKANKAFAEALGKSDEDLKKSENLAYTNLEQAYRFFTPNIRKRIFNIGKDNRTEYSYFYNWQYQLDKENNNTISVEKLPPIPSDNSSTNKDTLSSQYKLSELLLLINDNVGVLTFSIENYDVDGSNTKSHCLWHSLWRKYCLGNIQLTTLREALFATQQVRYLYPGFHRERAEGKLGKVTLELNGDSSEGKEDWKDVQVEDDNHIYISKVIKKLLEKLPKKLQKDIDNHIQKTFRDNRLFVSASYSLVGNYQNTKPQKSVYKNLFKVALDVDIPEANKDYVRYDEAFSKKYFNDYTYTRWAHLGSYYGFNEYAAIYWGIGGYNTNVISKVNVPYQYQRMNLLNLVYREKMRYFEREINGGEISSIREEFVKFANRDWFKHVTDQQQGDEMFAIQQRAFRLEESYQQINDEIDLKDRLKQDKRNELFNQLAMVIAFLTIIFGLMTLPNLDSYISDQYKDLVGHINEIGINEFYKKLIILLITFMPAIVIVLTGLSLFKKYKAILKIIGICIILAFFLLIFYVIFCHLSLCPLLWYILPFVLSTIGVYYVVKKIMQPNHSQEE